MHNHLHAHLLALSHIYIWEMGISYVLYIVGDRLKPHNSVFQVYEKNTHTKNNNNSFNQNIFLTHVCTIVSTYVCCYDFLWRKRVGYEWFFLEHEDTCFLSFNTWSIVKTYEDLSHNQNIPLERSDVVKTTGFFDKSAIASMDVCCMISHQNNIN